MIRGCRWNIKKKKKKKKKKIGDTGFLRYLRALIYQDVAHQPQKPESFFAAYSSASSSASALLSSPLHTW
jgi:hypothetical protein